MISELTKKCIQSWKKFLPDFEIKEWNETNFDVNQCPFVKQAYEQKKWAFVADYTRFKVLEEYGGIYLDTDMEITADISKYLELDLFMGQEDSKMINAAVVWAKEAHNPHIKDIVNVYESAKMFNETGDLYEQSVPRVLTKYFEGYGFNKELDKVQVLDDGKINIYPMEYFYPLSYDYQHNKFTDNSCMIHHFDATWISKMELFKTKMKRKNMKWVVYVIDFFINLKNFILSFLNMKDVTIFVTSLIILLSIMLAYTPINNVSQDYLFNSMINNKAISIVQIVVFSYLWTFVLKRIRLIDINQLLDKITGRDKNPSIQSVKLKDDQRVYVEKYETKIYLFQFIVTVLLLFLAPVYTAIIIPNIKIVYSLMMLMTVYYVYTGVRKDFMYRIKELWPFALILGILATAFDFRGVFFVLPLIIVLSFLFKGRINLKRKIVFFTSFAVAIIIGLTLNFTVLTEKELEYSMSSQLVNFESIEEYKGYDKFFDENTEFNYLKEKLGNKMCNYDESSIVIKPTVILLISVALIFILVLVSKNISYLIVLIPLILNAISVKYISLADNTYSFVNYIALGLAIIFVLQAILKKIRKNYAD